MVLQPNFQRFHPLGVVVFNFVKSVLNFVENLQDFTGWLGKVAKIDLEIRAGVGDNVWCRSHWRNNRAKDSDSEEKGEECPHDDLD